MSAPLPRSLAPMLARIGEPFDADDHLFEVKWDGTRALTFAEGDAVRLRNRRDRDMAPRYPELDFLAGLPAGTLLDGEVVVLRDGLPDFEGMLTREQAGDPRRVARLAAESPASYVVFDLLYADGQARLDDPLGERRARLAELVASVDDPRLIFSDGLVGDGIAWFEQVTARGLEGVMAKRLDSPYLPGRRSDAWLKIKPRHELLCLILGYVADADGLKSLVIAADEGAGLRCVGKVGSGLTRAQADTLLPRLRARERAEPLVPAAVDGTWVEPGLYCRVTYTEHTGAGNLRAPVLRGLLLDEGD